MVTVLRAINMANIMLAICKESHTQALAIFINLPSLLFIHSVPLSLSISISLSFLLFNEVHGLHVLWPISVCWPQSRNARCGNYATHLAKTHLNYCLNGQRGVCETSSTNNITHTQRQRMFIVNFLVVSIAKRQVIYTGKTT